MHLINLGTGAHVANPKKPSSNEPDRVRTSLRIKWEESLRRTNEQTSLARDMVERIREMCDRADEMRKPPNVRYDIG